MKNKMPTRINDYIFETLLGKGTFGSVYLVRRKKDSKTFVVKEQVLNDANALPFKIVLGEVKCLERMRHPNIVSYHKAWIENNHSYILMEYATRCTLKDLLGKRDVPLNTEDALYLFSQIVLGVHHIHSKKILHRDLKPENIMLTGCNGDIVKIGDFGVSKNLEELKYRPASCRAGSFYYMAPEMLMGQSYDFKCDVWSMGIVLYEMVTKTLPFPATSLAEVMKMTREENPRPFRRNVSAIIVNLISKMLRKQSIHRPKIDQLILCPYLVPYVARVYLNLGRSCYFSKRDNGNLNSGLFLKFLKPRESRGTILT